jgi:hypothetical protein
MGMDKKPKEGLGETVDELIAIKYELALYVDDGLLELGESLEKTIHKLIQIVGTF